MNTYETIGANVKRLRQEQGLTQEDLAGRVGFLRTSVVNIEKGRQRVPLHTLEQVARALGVSPGRLLPAAWWQEGDAAGVAELAQKLADVRVMLSEIVDELG